jgi:hypothetical protein
MQYLLLIYDDEKRWNEGYAEAELGEYRAFTRSSPKPSREATRCSLRARPPPCACGTVSG